jgi:hypothetical protein
LFHGQDGHPQVMVGHFLVFGLSGAIPETLLNHGFMPISRFMAFNADFVVCIPALKYVFS